MPINFSTLPLQTHRLICSARLIILHWHQMHTIMHLLTTTPSRTHPQSQPHNYASLLHMTISPRYASNTLPTYPNMNSNERMVCPLIAGKTCKYNIDHIVLFRQPLTHYASSSHAHGIHKLLRRVRRPATAGRPPSAAPAPKATAHKPFAI